MATIESLTSDVAALISQVNSIASQQSINATAIHNLRQDVDALDDTVKDHTELLNDHDLRLQAIDNSSTLYIMIPWKNECKKPSVNSFGEIDIFLPPYTKEELKECNEDIPGLVQYKWWQKIFNPREQGDVSFDFQDIHDYLESINLGPHSYIRIPLSVILSKEMPYPPRKYVIECSNPVLICTQQFYHPGEKTVITLYNFSNSTINIRTNDPVIRLTPVYGYQTKLIRE